MTFEVLIKEVIQLLLINWDYWVDPGACWRVWGEFYGVVSFLLIQELIKGDLGKDILELLVGFGQYVLNLC